MPLSKGFYKMVFLKQKKDNTMDKIIRFENVKDYNALNHHETLHPLVGVIDFSKSKPWSWPGGKTIKVNYGLYCIFLKEIKCGDLKYGCNYYDYQEGSLVFISPGQIVEVEYLGENFQPKGYALMFHPDMIHGTALGRHIQDYSFFGYQSHEALHLSKTERQMIVEGFSKIQHELLHPIDKHSKR